MQTIKDLIEMYYFQPILWLGITYTLVVAGVAIDLITGIYKSHANGQPIHSTGLKRSCRKLGDYLLPMFVLSLIDLLHAGIVQMPWLTIGYGMFCLVCELVSIFESSGRKRQLHTLVKSARQLSHRQLGEAISTIINSDKDSDGEGQIDETD